MCERLTPEHERYVRDLLAVGTFASRREVLDEGIRLLKWRGRFLGQLIGGGSTTDGLGELFDEVRALGRARYEAGRETN